MLYVLGIVIFALALCNLKPRSMFLPERLPSFMYFATLHEQCTARKKDISAESEADVKGKSERAMVGRKGGAENVE